jgi:hypothetical protein
VLAVVSACKRTQHDAYWRTVEHGITNVPHVSEITALFSNAPTDHFIGQYSWNPAGPVMWNTQVYFHGRYHFTYQVPVTADYTNCMILGTSGPPVFVLLEVEKTDGRSTQFSSDWKLSESQWNKVVAAKGDFSVVGIQLKTNQPVANWDAYVKAGRSRWKK